MFIPAAECQTNCTFVTSYFGLMTDWPHICFEITLTIIQDVVIGLLFWRLGLKPLMNRWRDRVHREIDQEHGIVHSEEGLDIDPASVVG